MDESTAGREKIAALSQAAGRPTESTSAGQRIRWHVRSLLRRLRQSLPDGLSIDHARRVTPYLLEKEVSFHFGQFGEDAVLQGYFAAKAWGKYGDPTRIDPGFYVDVGAFHPTRYSNTFWFYKRGWRGITIEPSPGSKERFDRVRPGDLCLECAISSSPGQLTFFSFGSPNVVNTLCPDHARAWSERLGTEPRRLEVQVRTLRDVLDEHLPPGQAIDFMSVDCEGRDLEALQSNDWDAYRPELVVTENHCDDVDMLLSSDVHRLMTDAGYAIHCWVRPSVVYRARERPAP